VVINASGGPVPVETPVFYHPLPPERSVRRALKAEEYPAAADAEPSRGDAGEGDAGSA
jgi:hypothetical protein